MGQQGRQAFHPRAHLPATCHSCCNGQNKAFACAAGPNLTSSLETPDYLNIGSFIKLTLSSLPTATAMRVHAASSALLLVAALLLLLKSSHVAGFNPAIGGRRLMSLGKMTCSQCEGHGNTYDCPRNEAELRRIIAKWGYAETVDMCCPLAFKLPHFTEGDSGPDSSSAHTLWWAKVTRGCEGSIRTRYTLTADLSALVTTMSGGFVCPDEKWPVYECVYE